MSTTVPARLPARRRLIFRVPRLPVTATLSGAFLLLVIVCAVFPQIAPQDPAAISAADSLLKPDAAHMLGTDQLGRDIFSRLIAGAGSSLLGPAVLAAAATAISAALALIAGYTGGRTDAVISRGVDFLYSIPALMVAIVVAGVTGGGYAVTIAVLVIFGIPKDVRSLRASVIERAHLPYMEAAATLGLPKWRIVLTHLLPTVVPFIVAVFFLTFTYSVVALSSLSFLGLGAPPGATDWGRMVADNRATLFGNVWATAGPAIAIVSLAVTTSLIGEWINNRYENAGRQR